MGADFISNSLSYLYIQNTRRNCYYSKYMARERQDLCAKLTVIQITGYPLTGLRSAVPALS
jgi:hypothetical protein